MWWGGALALLQQARQARMRWQMRWQHEGPRVYCLPDAALREAGPSCMLLFTPHMHAQAAELAARVDGERRGGGGWERERERERKARPGPH